ncbi:hypothetical protein DFS34DRAFT_499737 [Phlyctochytrium arcticum]|nr:hypothetical protein DFS34DRAFT_499737 [Phlyctochytrium arcticum]
MENPDGCCLTCLLVALAAGTGFLGFTLKTLTCADTTAPLPTFPVSHTYTGVVQRYVRLATRFHWTNPDGSFFPMSLVNISHWLSYHTSAPAGSQVLASSLYSYLSALKDHHTSLGFDWSSVRQNPQFTRALRQFSRRQIRRPTTQAQEVSLEDLHIFFSRSLPQNLFDQVYRAIAATAFWGLARLREVVTDGSPDMLPEVLFRSHVSRIASPLVNGVAHGYAILLPRPKITTTYAQYLVLCPVNDMSCPVRALDAVASSLPNIQHL